MAFTIEQNRAKIAELRLQGVKGDGITRADVPGLLAEQPGDDRDTQQLRRAIKAGERLVAEFQAEQQRLAESGLYTAAGLEQTLAEPRRKLRQDLLRIRDQLVQPRATQAAEALEKAPRPEAQLPELPDSDRHALLQAYRDASPIDRLRMERSPDVAAALLNSQPTLSGLTTAERDRVVNALAQAQDPAKYEAGQPCFK